LEFEYKANDYSSDSNGMMMMMMMLYMQFAHDGESPVLYNCPAITLARQAT
jgi:hypothetical protein